MSIKEIIEVTGEIRKVYIGKGIFDELNCKYNKPAKYEDIQKFAQELDAIVPKDYMEFLLITNGMSFYNAGDFTLFSIEEILEIQKSINYKKGIYPIGCILEDYIVIKSDEIDSGEYIYAGDVYCCDEYFPLYTNFTEFFDRLVISSACNYWRWQIPKEKFNFIDY